MRFQPPRATVRAACLAAVFSLLFIPSGSPCPAAAPPGNVVELSPSLAIYRGPINTGILREGDAALLIDCGDGSVAGVLPELGIKKVERLLFTHHHRDQACGANRFIESGAAATVPAAERDWFANVARFWDDSKSRWNIYNFHPHRLMLTESIPVAATVEPGDRFAWRGASISVVATPGHTDGSVSYLVQSGGRKTMFCGDAIYDAGQIWELYSLQKGFQRGKRRIGDYHGFLGAKDELVEGLGRIKQSAPEVLVPAHGNIMDEPRAAIDALVDRLNTCYDRYVAISALRHYFPELFEEFQGRPGHMPIRPGRPAPDCLLHLGTSWVILSRDKAAFVIDCGHERRIDDLKKLISEGRVKSVDGLWITHYHDDHAAAIPAFQKSFDCPCYADRHVAEVIANPIAWRIPCISASVARVDKVPAHGESWQWREFKMTSYHLPGQTLYHGGLLVEGGGLRMLFAGDSFTPAGIDDYCALNRNWLGRGAGFQACLDLMQRIKPTDVFNCHVDVAFDFTADQYRAMQENLDEREGLFGRLFPWEQANYGMDESWVRAFPYEQSASPGERVKVQVFVTNHSAGAREAAARLVVPRSWRRGGEQATPWAAGELPAKRETPLEVRLQIPGDAKPGRYPVAIDVFYDDRSLPEFSEAIIVVR